MYLYTAHIIYSHGGLQFFFLIFFFDTLLRCIWNQMHKSSGTSQVWLHLGELDFLFRVFLCHWLITHFSCYLFRAFCIVFCSLSLLVKSVKSKTGQFHEKKQKKRLMHSWDNGAQRLRINRILWLISPFPQSSSVRSHVSREWPLRLESRLSLVGHGLRRVELTRMSTHKAGLRERRC